MFMVKTLLCAVALDIFADVHALTSIECVPLEDCPFALNILAKGHHQIKYIVDFVNSTKCGVQQETQQIKVWCAMFVNCRTPDFRNGMCLPSTHCKDVFLEDPISSDYQCNIPGRGNYVYVCCPWSLSFKQKRRHLDEYEYPSHHHYHDFGTMDNRLHPSTPDEKSTNEFHAEHDNWWTDTPFNPEDSERVHLKRESCKTPDNDEGTCKDVYQCSSMLDILRNLTKRDSNLVTYLRRFKCPNQGQGNREVCCPFRPIILPTFSSGNVTIKSLSEEQTCGQQSIDNKIVGGSAAGLAEYPWAALLEYNSTRGRQYGCGGSVISKRYVLTAAHCVDKGILDRAGLEQVDRVILGEYDTRNETDCFFTTFGSECADPVQKLSIERIIQHKEFSVRSSRNDIALIRVNRDIIFSKYVKPICLPQRDFGLQGNENFFITGWGKTETGIASPVKQKARIPLTAKENCNQLGPLGEGQICSASSQGIDSCKGDSGGPVMKVGIESGDIVVTIVGIISYGFGRCGTTNGVQTYVPFYIDWINENLN